MPCPSRLYTDHKLVNIQTFFASALDVRPVLLYVWARVSNWAIQRTREKVKSRCKEGNDFQNRNELVSGRKELKETEEVAVERNLKRGE
jgi:hypothetical protein